MPYVWGGSSPETSFDCSGFVSYVFTNSGVCNMGRLTAQGIYDICMPVSPEEARPGDIIFFTGTYDAGEPVTHVEFMPEMDRCIHIVEIQFSIRPLILHTGSLIFMLLAGHQEGRI